MIRTYIASLLHLVVDFAICGDETSDLALMVLSYFLWTALRRPHHEARTADLFVVFCEP